MPSSVRISSDTNSQDSLARRYLTLPVKTVDSSIVRTPLFYFYHH